MGEKIAEVVWTDPAKKDLRQIFDYYFSVAGERVAEKIANGILEEIEILFLQPQVGAIEELLLHKQDLYRYLVKGNYKIIYRVKKNVIVIDALFDCRQNPTKMKVT